MTMLYGLGKLAEERQAAYVAEARNDSLSGRRTRVAGPRRPAAAVANVADFAAVCGATAAAHVRRSVAYVIDVVRWPLGPLLYYVTLLLTYHISGRTVVAGMPVAGFLLVGTVGMILWQATLWNGGYAIERERFEGTLPSLLLSPASRSAVVFGYTLASMAVYVIPNVLVLAVLALLSGAHVDVRDPLAAALATLSLAAAASVLGYTLAGLFVLTRRANLLANFLQSPIYLLSGMVVPISSLPGPLRSVARVFPISFGMDALRQTLLLGAGLGQVAPALIRLVVASTALAAVGTWLLRRVEHVAKSGAELDVI
ncbi:MAG TPA: ABC transporter permease [Thermomicrobiaceae bacterium]|nr:ABC transporter permease [Thermomicrobiaceae bacterium]